MKLNDQKLNLASRKLTLREGVEFMLTALPIGSMHAYNAVFPSPVPPIKTLADKKGTRLEHQFNDPTYVKDTEEHAELKNYYFVYLSLRNDKNIVFDNIPTDRDSLNKFATELKESGLSEGELAILLMAATKLSSISAEDLDRAKENF